MSGSWKAVAFYPPSWVAITAVVLAVGAILVMLEPSPLLSVVVVIVGIVAVIAWPVILSATGTLDELRSTAPEPSRVGEAEVSELGDQLDRLEDSRPSDQLREIRKAHDSIVTLLDRRRQAGDLVYERYRPGPERVYSMVIANLREILADTTSSSAEGNRVITLSDNKLPPAESTHPSEGGEQAAAKTPLAQNDVAIAAMDRASIALGGVPIGLSTSETTAALEALQELADQPGK